MKVALIVPGGVDPSGTRRVVPCFLWLIQRIARQHQVHVFAFFQEGAPPRYMLRGAHVHHIGRPRTAMRAMAALWAEHRRQHFDVLHGIFASPAGAFATLAGRALRRPAVVHLCGGELVSLPEVDYGEQRTPKGRRRVRLVLDHARSLTAQSAPMVAAAASMGATARRLPLGVDLNVWRPMPPRPREPERPARLLHVASLSPVKDQAMLLDAAARLAAAGLRFTLDIVGEDTLNGRIQAQAQAAGLEGSVRFHGFLEQDRLRPLMLAADLLLVTSRHEGGPIVLAEAAASGVPTVGTAVGQIAEWAPAAAIAAPVGDAEAFAREVRALLEDEPRRLRTAALAGERAVAEDADWTAHRVSSIYQEVTNA